jgi:hypothetical protein
MKHSNKGKKQLMTNTVLLHNDKELDDNFGGWSNHDLTLSSFLSIVHALQSIIQHTNSHHGCCYTNVNTNQL